MTICAISTPAGRGGIAVIRISGPQAIQITEKIWKGRPLTDAPTHTAHFGRIIDPDDHSRIIDEAVATIFRGPRSFTGEDTVEISVHGSTYIQAEVIQLLTKTGARIAAPGEFTQRAFTNGRLDLAQAEAVADLIATSSRAAHNLAISQLSGRFSSHIEELRAQLINLAALLELELDFSEEDVSFADRNTLRQLALKIIDHLCSLSKSFSTGQAIINGTPVAIIGQPNAGKSSLLNALLHTDRAIVSDIPGTTRDTIEDTTEINGHLIRFIDTAGIRDTADPIETLGIRRAYKAAQQASIILLVIDPTEAPYSTLGHTITQLTADSPATIIPLLNKTDQLTPDQTQHHLSLITRALKTTDAPHTPVLPISATQAQGIDNLCQQIHQHISSQLPPEESIIITNARHHQAITEAHTHLTDLITAIDTGLTPDLQAHHLRQAISTLATITGEITTPTLLQTIFSRFCICK